MRISPAVFEVQAGTRLMLDVTNADAMRHDLLLATGPDRGTAFRVVGATFQMVFAEGAYRLKAGNRVHGASRVMDLAPAQGVRRARASSARSLPIHRPSRRRW